MKVLLEGGDKSILNLINELKLKIQKAINNRLGPIYVSTNLDVPSSEPILEEQVAYSAKENRF